MTELVRDTAGMLAGMTPLLQDGDFVFCSLVDESRLAGLSPLATFREAEGLSVILARSAAAAAGFDSGLAMRRITLQVHSALDGVGLTAGVATALADAGIPCNMVAAFHHDHVFVPAAQAEQALQVLLKLQAAARAR
jgi:hypothetical protein